MCYQGLQFYPTRCHQINYLLHYRFTSHTPDLDFVQNNLINSKAIQFSFIKTDK